MPLGNILPMLCLNMFVTRLLLHLLSTMLREGVSVRIRGHGERTLAVKFRDAETVADFKARVFGDEIAKGKKCRLIASGKELQDFQQMGFYRLQQDACLHVMINQRAAAAPAPAASATPPTSVPESASTIGAQPPPGPGVRPAATRTVSEGREVAILCALTLAMVIAAWTARMTFPDFFSSEATGLLLLLTSLQLAATLPLLKKALLAALGACSCWWRPSSGGGRAARAPGRRRQQ